MKIVIGADLVPTENSEPLFIAGETQKLFGDVLPILESADRFFINLECALTTSDNAIPKCGPNIKAAPACADCLKKLGVTDVMLSNNHTFDFGIEGLRDTMDNLDRVGIPYTGVGENDTLSRKIYYFEEEGKRIAVINVCEHEYSYALPHRLGANPYDPYLTMHDIREAKKHADFVIVIYHGGKEMCRYPSPRLRRLCHEMVECGASAVITQHSHCIGCYEEYEGGKILYGQGNFHFVKDYWMKEWYTSLLLELEITDTVCLTFYPMVIDVPSGSVALAKGEEAEEIMSEFQKRNEELQSDAWLDGWRAFCERSQKGYRAAVQNALAPDKDPEQTEELFAHFLDCEAHADVWHELFKTKHHTNEC